MSNPADDDPGTSDNALIDSQVTWESVAEKLQKVSKFSPASKSQRCRTMICTLLYRVE